MKYFLRDGHPMVNKAHKNNKGETVIEANVMLSGDEKITKKKYDIIKRKMQNDVDEARATMREAKVTKEADRNKALGKLVNLGLTEAEAQSLTIR